MRRLLFVLALFPFACSNGSGNNKNNTSNNVVAVGFEGLVVNELAAAGDPTDWFELYNGTEREIDLSDLTYSDNFMTTDRATLSGTISPGEFLRVDVSAETSGFGLGSGEQLGIYSEGAAIDEINWSDGDSLVDRSFGRIPDGTGDFIRLNTPSPGEPNIDNDPNDPLCGDETIEGDEVCDLGELDSETCASRGFASGTLACAATCTRFDFSECLPTTGDVRINELSASGDDMIELVNTGDTDVDITGWYIADRGYTAGDEAHRFIFDGTIAAGEYRSLTKDVDHTFGVGGGDELRLYDAGDAIVDFVTWSSPDADVSFCRIPDGTGDFETCSPTFGSANAN